MTRPPAETGQDDAPRPTQRRRWPWILGATLVLAAIIAATVMITRNVVTQPQPAAHATPTAPASMAPPTSTLAAPASSGTTTSGFLQKKIGERAAMMAEDGTLTVNFYITKITVDPKCSPYAPSRPDGKHALLVDVSVQTEKFPTDMDRVAVGSLFNPFAFQTRSADGVTHTAGAGSCLSDAKRMPDSYAPNSKYTGQLDLEVEDRAGSLLLAPGGLGDRSGWEWQY